MNSKEPEWFKSFRLNLDQRLDNIDKRLDKVEQRLDNIESDIKLMKATPTMAKELNIN